MKNARFQSIAICLAFVCSLFLTTCKKDETHEETDQEVSFTIGSIKDGEGSNLKCAPIYSLDRVKKIVLTIQNKDGSPTNYTSSELSIHRMNNQFFSQKIILKTGEYKLTEFFLIDSAGNTIFIAPIKGSPEAQKVDNALPYPFGVWKNTSYIVSIEVVSTYNKQPEDFGVSSFLISERKGLTFQIAVADAVYRGWFLSANLKIGNIKNLDFNQTFSLEAIANNKCFLDTSGIDIILGQDLYLVVSKEGYIPYFRKLKKSSLEQYTSVPLLIELEKVKYQTGSVTDVDGNKYKTVKIGDQWWMAENLKTRHYSDGTFIDEISLFELHFWDGPDTIRKANCGSNYSWVAAMNDTSESAISQHIIQGVCPSGWHLPRKDEWLQLVNYLKANGYGYNGSDSLIGKSLASTQYWRENNELWSIGGIQETNNSTGFSAATSNYITKDGWIYDEEGDYASWWSSTVEDHRQAWGIMMTNLDGYGLSINRKELKSQTFSRGDFLNVRCLKN